jgi:transposase
MWLLIRSLTPEEAAQLEELARSSDTITYRRARVILLSAQGRRVPAIMAALGLCDRTVRDTIHRFEHGGVAALRRRQAPGKPRRCDTAAREALVELLHRPPTDFGIESQLWTAADLAAVATRQGIVTTISPDTVRREIRRSGKSWQRAKRWTTSPDPDYTEKRGASSGSRSGR